MVWSVCNKHQGEKKMATGVSDLPPSAFAGAPSPFILSLSRSLSLSESRSSMLCLGFVITFNARPARENPSCLSVFNGANHRLWGRFGSLRLGRRKRLKMEKKRKYDSQEIGGASSAREQKRVRAH
jgi:hypothetical protein